MKRGILKRFGVLGMSALMAFSLWACKPEKQPSKTPLTKPAGVSVSYDRKTGANAVATWNAVDHADSYDVSVKKGAQVVETQNVAEARAELDETKLVKNGQYTITVVARGSGDYTDSAAATYSFTYELDNETTLTPLASMNMKFDKETKMLSWAAIPGVKPVESYEVVIKDAAGNVLNTYGTAATEISLSNLGLQEVANAGTATGVAKAPAGGDRSDSLSSTITLNNEKEVIVDPGEELNKRMKAYEAWETEFKTKVGTSLTSAGVNPVVNEIHAVDIKDSSTAGKSIVAVYASYVDSGISRAGSVQYEIDKVQGTSYQEKLNDINDKIAKSNIVADTKSFTTINLTAPALIDDLKASPKLTTGGLKGITIEEKVTEYATSVSGTGTRAYSVGGLVKATDGKWYNLGYIIDHTNGLAGTSEQIYGYLASGNNVTAITEGRWNELTGVAEYFELKEEYQTWRLT